MSKEITLKVAPSTIDMPTNPNEIEAWLKTLPTIVLIELYVQDETDVQDENEEINWLECQHLDDPDYVDFMSNPNFRG